MKRFLSAVCLCVLLLVAGLVFLLPASSAQNNVLQNLLELPAPPPPNPLVKNRLRDGNFYSKNNPPGDDAPIDDLIEYWKTQSRTYRELGYNIKPSGKSLDRILSEIEENPELLSELIKILPDTEEVADFVKRMYDKNSSNEDFEEGWSDMVAAWLLYHNKDYSDDLLKIARNVGDEGEYVSNQDALLSLARVDWEKARPLVERLYNDSRQPVSQILARWAFYRHALDTDSIGDIDKYRDELKAVVENKSATDGMRDLAFDALVKEKEWKERDDWYMTLLEDETLADLRVNGSSYTGLTTVIYYSPPERYAEKMIELLKSDSQTVRNAAVRNLVRILNEKNPEVIRALLPWLEDANWAKEVNTERQSLVRILAELKMPESVLGLIALLNEAEKREQTVPNGNTIVLSNKLVYTNSNTSAQTVSVTVYPYRASAVSALAAQRDARAAAALRAILPQVEDYQRSNVVYAILVSNGFSVPEQMEALELAAKNAAQANTVTTNMMSNTMPMSNMVMMNTVTVVNMPSTIRAQTYDPNDIKAVLGNQIINNPEPSTEFVSALIDRIGVLETKNPSLAFTLRRIMLNWRGAAINSLFLRDLKNGKANEDSIMRLLILRKELREKQINEIYDARGGGNQTAFGITACFLEDSGEYGAILSGENAESKIALLACARLIRAALPVQKVAESLKSPNKTLALAAEIYLESEDSPEARQIVLSMHPDEAKILGARTYFAKDDAFDSGRYTAELFASVNAEFGFADYYYSGSDFEELQATEKMLQKEIKENQELLGVYAYDGYFIRIYKDKAVFSRTENAARYRERELKKEEFDNLKYYLSSQRVDELPPFLVQCVDCKERELLMLGRGGGRRIFVKAERMPQFFAQLDDMFEEMSKPPAKLRYGLERKVAGLEILFADDILQARAVWKIGDDFRVLLDDTERRKRIDKELMLQDQADENREDVDYEQYEAMSRKRREQRKYENFSWFKFAGGKLGDFSTQPPMVDYLPTRDSFPAQAESGQWKSKTADIEIRADDEGLYKLSRGAFSKIRTGYYRSPVVTSNGRWAIATKYDPEEGEMTPLRINLVTNKEFKIVVPDSPVVEAVAFVPSINKVLIFAGYYYEEESERSGNYFLLDAETGAVQAAKGEIQPLIQQTFRPLQPAPAADEFWAAIPDAEKNETQLGIYNAKTLSFKTLLQIPQITFDSMNMWVDSGKVYFVYEGHLLSLPIPKG